MWKKVICIIVATVCISSIVFAENESTMKDAKKFFKKGKYKIAITVYQNIIENEETNEEIKAEAQYNIGMCYYYLWSKQRAIKEFQKVVDNYPDTEYAVESQKWKGVTYYYNKDYENAINEYEKVSDLTSDEEKIDNSQYKIANCYEKLKRHKDAEKTYEKIEKSNHKSNKWKKKATSKLKKIRKFKKKNEK